MRTFENGVMNENKYCVSYASARAFVVFVRADTVDRTGSTERKTDKRFGSYRFRPARARPAKHSKHVFYRACVNKREGSRARSATYPEKTRVYVLVRPGQ